MGDIGSKTRSVGQIIEKPCEHSRGHSFCPVFIELGQDRIWIMVIGSKTRSVGQIIEKPCEHSERPQFWSNLHQTWSTIILNMDYLVLGQKLGQ